jgi:hypothetical protein
MVWLVVILILGLLVPFVALVTPLLAVAIAVAFALVALHSQRSTRRARPLWIAVAGRPPARRCSSVLGNDWATDFFDEDRPPKIHGSFAS